MRPILRKLKPTSGFAYFLHLGLVLILPVAVFVLVRLNFTQLAFLMVALSKWRVFAVRPRFWASNIRANAVDVMVGLSTVIFMLHTDSLLLQFALAALYAIWLVAIKPGSTIRLVTAQAFIGQFYALSALYLAGVTAPVYILTLAAGAICFLAARHFLDTFDEPYAPLLALIWGYFGAALAWLLSHWLLFYRQIAQPMLLLCVLGYGLGVLYYLDHTGKLNKALRRQFLFVIMSVVLVLLAFSDWGNKVV